MKYQTTNRDIIIRGLRKGTKRFFEPWVCLFKLIGRIFSSK